MKRLIFGGLSILLLASAAAPAFAFTQRFEDARRENLNKGVSRAVILGDRFEDARRENLNKLTGRFEEAQRQNLDK